MKRCILFFSVLYSVFFLVACTDITNSQDTTLTPTAPLSHGETPPQPIAFDNLESAVDFLQNPDYSNYNDKWESTYQQMVEEFVSDGYLLTASHKTATVSYGKVTLFPRAKYEDIGVAYWFDLNGESYQVMLYNTKTGAEFSINAETQDITDYNMVRFGVSENAEFERITVNHPNVSEMILSTRNYHICAQSMIDETHYIIVTAVTDTNAETLKTFIEGLVIDRHTIK